MSDVPSATTLNGVGGTFPPKQWLRLGVDWEKRGLKAQNFDAKPAEIKLTPDALTKMQEVMRSLPVQQYVHDDKTPWSDDPEAKAGDCNTLALGRRRALAAAGFPMGALRPAIVQTMHKEWHLVLTIDTDHGTFVVDGTQPMLQPWQRAPFKWKSRLVSGMTWERFDP